MTDPVSRLGHPAFEADGQTLKPGNVRYKNGAIWNTEAKSFYSKDGVLSARSFGPRKVGRPKGSMGKNKPRPFVKAAPPEPTEEYAPTDPGDRPTRKNPDADLGAAPEPEREKKEYTKDEKIMLARQVVGVHQMIAMMTGLPEMAISDQEGEVLADAMAGIAREYGVAVSGKAAAGMQMFAACAMIYAPRVLQISARANREKQAAAQARQRQGESTRAPSFTQPGPVTLDNELPSEGTVQ